MVKIVNLGTTSEIDVISKGPSDNNKAVVNISVHNKAENICHVNLKIKSGSDEHYLLDSFPIKGKDTLSFDDKFLLDTDGDKISIQSDTENLITCMVSYAEH